MKLLSWNIWFFCDFGRLREFLEKSDADIVCLQEVRDDDPSRDVIGLMEKMGYGHVYAPFEARYGDKAWRYGPAVFSRLPIVGSEKIALSDEDARPAVRADIDVGGKILHVFSAHLTHVHDGPADIRDSQASRLLGRLPADNVIVAGDFNAAPDSDTARMMRDALADADPESLPTWSVYPEGCPVCRPSAVEMKFDYIFTSRDLKSRSFQVHDSRASDHLPISALIEI